MEVTRFYKPTDPKPDHRNDGSETGWYWYGSASIRISSMVLHNIKLKGKPNPEDGTIQFSIQMPTVESKGQYFPVYRPASSAEREELTKLIVAAYNAA